jgi:acetoacetyl-CoA synthetase
MMWNWLASALASEATLLLYDGSPFVGRGRVLFDYAQAEGMTHFGTSAKFIDACAKINLKPRETHDLSALRALFSTGSPLAPESFDYVYRDIKPDLQLASISGGTDIVSCFVLGNPLGPVWRGEIQCAGLGMAVDVVDENSKCAPVGAKGELVCARPFPSMPVGFWNDADGAKCRTAASSSTAARTPRSTPAACASARRKSIARSRNCPRYSNPSSSARTGKAMCASSCSSSCRKA